MIFAKTFMILMATLSAIADLFRYPQGHASDSPSSFIGDVDVASPKTMLIDENRSDEDCDERVTEKTVNVGGNRPLVSASKTTGTTRLLLPKDEQIRFDFVTDLAFQAFKVPTWFEFARSKQSFSYLFDDPAFVNSCYDYNIILGFTELESTYCTKETNRPKRIMDVIVNAGDSDQIASGLNVAEETGGDCFQAHMIGFTVQPKASTINVTVTATVDSDGIAILSFIKIKKEDSRRLGADCNK